MKMLLIPEAAALSWTTERDLVLESQRTSAIAWTDQFMYAYLEAKMVFINCDTDSSNSPSWNVHLCLSHYVYLEVQQ